MSGRGGPTKGRGAEESEPVVSRHIPGDGRYPPRRGAALTAVSVLGPSCHARLTAGAGPLPPPALPPVCPLGKGEEEKHPPGWPPRQGQGGFWQLWGPGQGTLRAVRDGEQEQRAEAWFAALW